MPSALPRLSSRQHPAVRAIRRAAADPAAASGAVLDGAHVIREALSAGLTVRTVIISPEFLNRAPAEADLVTEAARAGATVYQATAAVLEAASPVRTSSGIVALADWSPAPLPAALDPSRALAIGLIDVQDPGNVGAVIRSADALGATGVLALDATAHPGGWKALRGAMGSTFRLNVARGRSAAALAAARAAGVRVLATVAAKGTPVERCDLTTPSLVLIGNEGTGLPPAIVADADDRISIPMRAGANSLNVAVTAALVLYEARRQRGTAGTGVMR